MCQNDIQFLHELRGSARAALRSLPDRVIALMMVFLSISSVQAQQLNESASTGPQRIVVIAPNAAEIVCALGACDRIVGVDKYCIFPPELSSRPQVGGLMDPDLERIVLLRPDLFVLRGQSESLERLCRELHIDTYHDETDSLEGIQTCIHELGVKLKLEQKASQLIGKFKKNLVRLRERTAGKPRPRVLMTVMRQPDRLRDILTAGRGTFLNQMLELAGGENIFKDVDAPYPQVSMEAILSRRPDVIIELLPEIDVDEPRRRVLLSQWQKFETLPAVQTQRIYFVDDDYALIPSPRCVQIIEKLACLLHPELVSDEK